MNNATPHLHGHDTDPRAGRGPHAEHGHASTEHASHDQHAGHSPAMFRDKFWLSLALTGPVVFWSAHSPGASGTVRRSSPAAAWIPAVLATVVFLYGGWSF